MSYKKNISAFIFLVFIILFLTYLFSNLNNITGYVFSKKTDYSVILITIDTLRADHMGTYGYYRNTTPNIDNFAKKSILFSHAITQIPATLPSHVSILSSEYPHSHAVIFFDYKVNEGIETIQKTLKQHNYTTAAIVSYFVLNKKTGINQNFDFFYDNYTGDERKADETTNLALSWLENNKEKQFFLWVHYFDPHTPFWPPSSYRSLFDKNNDDPMTITVNDAGTIKNITLWYNNSQELTTDWTDIWNLKIDSSTLDASENISKIKSVLNISDKDFEKFMEWFNHKIALYDGEISYTDYNIGKLFEFLSANKMMENTIIVIAADHGESFAKGEYFDHGLMLEQNLHVPLILYYPQVNPRRVNATVSLIDISPTILGILNFSIPKQMVGKNLLEINDSCDCYSVSEKSQTLTKSIENNEWQLWNDTWHNVSTLYNIKDDPDEKINLYNARQDVVKNLTTRIEEILNGTSIGTPRKQTDIDFIQSLLRAHGYFP